MAIFTNENAIIRVQIKIFFILKEYGVYILYDNKSRKKLPVSTPHFIEKFITRRIFYFSKTNKKQSTP
jgi:hypothetical protein